MPWTLPPGREVGSLFRSRERTSPLVKDPLASQIHRQVVISWAPSTLYTGGRGCFKSSREDLTGGKSSVIVPRSRNLGWGPETIKLAFTFSSSRVQCPGVPPTACYSRTAEAPWVSGLGHPAARPFSPSWAWGVSPPRTRGGARCPQLRPHFVPGIGPGCGVGPGCPVPQQASSAEDAGRRQAAARPGGDPPSPGSRPLRGPRVHGSRPGAPRLPGAVRAASPSGGGGGGGAGPPGPGARGAGHAAAAARLPGLPGPGHRRVLGAGGPRGARLQREVPARQVGSAAELHVPGRPGAGLADPGHHPSLPKWGHCPWQHHQHGALGVRGLLLLFRVYHHHHRLWQPEPPDHGRPPLLHLLCSCGDPAQPRGAQPTGASHAAGDAPLCPQAGGHLAGPGQSSVAGGLQHPPLRPLVFPAAAPAALLPHGGLELRGEFLLRLHHPQHRGLWRLCDWDGPLPEVPPVVQEYSVPMDPLWDGVAGLDHQTHPLPAGDTREIVFLSPQLQRELQGPKLEAEPGWGSRTQFATARMLSGGAYGNHPAPRTLYSGLMQWRGQLVIYYSMCSIFFLSNKTPRFKLGT